jgi:DNA-binding response OmpR family regulator
MDALKIDPDVRHGMNSNLTFREYMLRPEDRLLLRNGCAIELGGRAFDLLCVLIRSRGCVVSKTEIFDHVWPTTTVDESNLRFQVAQLRRALGSDRDVIKTVKGRGYIMAADARSETAHEPDEPDWNVAAVQPRATTAGAGDGAAESTVFDPPVVAIIDDDDGTREALGGLFRSVGIRADLFASIADFIVSACRHSACCLILDVWMPDRTGLDFHDELRRQSPNLPVIFISGHADVRMSVRAMKAGALEFFTKPVRYQDLLLAVGQATGLGYSPCTEWS